MIYSFVVYCLLIVLQIERDTYGKLQCHPYPHEYIDTSKPCAHTSFFMGLQRKQGERIEEGQQFDIRGTVDEFRGNINMYMFWKPGMEIYVSHVRRRQIPSYVFPEGHRRVRSRPPNPQQGEATRPDNNSSGEKNLKRKKDPLEVTKNDAKRKTPSPQRRDSVSPEIITAKPPASNEIGHVEPRAMEVDEQLKAKQDNASTPNNELGSPESIADSSENNGSPDTSAERNGRGVSLMGYSCEVDSGLSLDRLKQEIEV